MVHCPYPAVCSTWGFLESPRAKLDPYAGVPGGPWTTTSHIWPGPIERVQNHKTLTFLNVEGEALVLLLLSLLPKYSKATLFPVPLEIFNQLLLPFLLPFLPHQACHDSSSKTIPHSTVQNFTYSHLSTAPVEEEKSFHLCCFLPPRYFSKGIVCLNQVTREDPNTASENQDAVAHLFKNVDRNSREVIMYANDRTIPGTASEEMAEKVSWYEDELINDFQRTFVHMGRED
ncbi:hypothetical protein O181_106263 [Austropuccinia psidii MF-1]|uniref:Uncharacterized protein n=1 Tax=Austropuccinia psidii MF-1 TaxID=1389203 RepID=A0A9Q3JQH1_9BASI|nr:hypothetical protein [Austropuccinia psidii MF-1]